MDIKVIINSIVDAFDKNDVEAVLSHLAEDAEWQIRGDQTISGKEAIGQFFADNQQMQMIASTKKHIIIDENRAAVEGDVQCKGRNGELLDMHYCDIYELENGKINRMITYNIIKKKDQEVSEQG